MKVFQYTTDEGVRCQYIFEDTGKFIEFRTSEGRRDSGANPSYSSLEKCTDFLKQAGFDEIVN